MTFGGGLVVISKSLLWKFEEVEVSCILETNGESSANIFAFVESPTVRLLMEVKDNKGPKLEPGGSLTLIFGQIKTCSMKTSHCFFPSKD